MYFKGTETSAAFVKKLLKFGKAILSFVFNGFEKYFLKVYLLSYPFLIL